MSFTKKINNFLDKALSEGILDQNTKQKLQNFAENYEHKSIFSFTNLITFFGGFTIILGIILIISSNWDKFSDLTKISAYTALLIGFHISAYLLQIKSPKISQIIYFIIAGYILAGIGLIAQIYNLSSRNAEVFLIWSILILPMALVLENSRIGLMAMIGLYWWIYVNASSNIFSVSNIDNLILFNTFFFSNMILFSRAFVGLRNTFGQIRFFGYFGLGTSTFVMCFANDFFKNYLVEIDLRPLAIVIIIFNFICLTKIFIEIFSKKIRFLEIAQMPEFIIILLNVLALLIFTKQFILISILYSAIWFLGSALMIYIGERNKNKTLINLGTWQIMLGIIARFINLIGTQLFTGAMFILLGTTLILIAYLGEKYRKNLIKKVFKNHVIQK